MVVTRSREKNPRQDPAPSKNCKVEESPLKPLGRLFSYADYSGYFLPAIIVAIRIPNVIIKVNVS